MPDKPPLERLMNELAAPLFAWASLRLRPALGRHVGPEDVVQEVWLRVLRIYDHSFVPGRGTARGFVFAVAKIVLLEVERHAARTAEREAARGGTSWQVAVGQVPETITSLTQRLSRDERVQRFLDQVGQLDDDERLLLLYCGMEDLPQREAAQRLAVSADVAAKRWQRLVERVQHWGSARDLLAG